jgi:uncharacterized membrane protein (GlpM family)
MDASFWIKLALSFMVGSMWVTFTTLAAERYGSKLGGLIGGFPSTVVIALFFIGLTQSPVIAAQATTVMPVAQGLNGIFIITFMFFISRGLGTSMLFALLVWIVQSTLLYLLDIQAFWVSIACWILLLAGCYFVIEKWMRIPSQSKLVISYPPSQLIWRAVFGGMVIAVAVFMGKLGGPLLGGIFGSFPAMFLSTLVITSRTGGADFSRAVGKSLLISGLVNVPLYEIVVRILYPELGLVVGTIMAILFSLGSGYLTYRFIQARLA